MCRVNRRDKDALASEVNTVRQLLPLPLSVIAPVWRPSVRADMISSTDGGSSVAGTSGGLSGEAGIDRIAVVTFIMFRRFGGR